MKNNIKLLIGLIILAIIVVVVVISRRDTKPMKGISLSSVQEIDICNPAETVTIKKQKDMKKLVYILQNMKMKKTVTNNKSGFAFIINMKLKDGKTYDITVRSKDIVINGKYYEPYKDYCNEIRYAFEALPRE